MSYSTGTVVVTRGSADVTGSGTAWLANVEPGDKFVGPDGRSYIIAGVSSDTALTLADAYRGKSETGARYSLHPVSGTPGVPFRNPLPHYASREAFENAVVQDWVEGWTLDHAGVTLAYRRDGLGTAIASANGVRGTPANDVTVLHWGVMPNDRAAAVANAARINAAADWCRANGVTRLIGVRGTAFFGDVIDLSGVIYEGHGIAQWEGGAAYYGARKLPAASQLVPVDGAWPTRIKIYGISSAKACGGARVFAAPRANIDETDWQMTSLMNSDATTGAATPKALKVGVVVRGVGGGLRNARIVPDGGGDDGLDAYNDASHGDLIGAMDIGLLQIGGHTSTYDEVQAVGHWRIAGAYVAAVDEDFDHSDASAPYDTIFRRCQFEGLRALAIRCQDRWKILGHTSTTVDLPWSDDHPFTLDAGVNRIRLVEVGAGTAGGATYTYTGVARVNVGGDDRVRLSGLTGFAPGSYGAVINGVAGGANSHIITRDTAFGGLTLPNGWPVNHATGGAGITNGAIGGIEVSGWRCAEEDIQGRVQHDGTVVLMKHDGREGIFDLLCEANARRDGSTGLRVIVSPQAHQNTHADHVAGEARWLEWRYLMQNEYSASGIDFAPFLPSTRPAAFAAADDGWFETYWGVRPLQVRHYSGSTSQTTRVGIPGPVGIGEGFEGYAGDVPEAFIHGRNPGGWAIHKMETQGADDDAGFEAETASHKAVFKVDESSGGDVILAVDRGKTGTYDDILRDEGGSAETGTHMERPVWLDQPTYVDKQRIISVDFTSRAAAIASTLSPHITQLSYLTADGRKLSFVEDAVTSNPALTTNAGARKWVPAEDATQYHYGAVGDYAADDTAAIDAWIGHFVATRSPLWAGPGVFRYHNKRLTLPEGIIIRGVGGPRIAAYPQRGAEKDKLRPGYKGTISGSVIVFSGTPADSPITTTRADRFASINPMVAYLHGQSYSISGLDFVQDMDVLNAGGTLTTAATDNRASGYDCGMVSKAYAPRVDVGIFGYFPKSGFVNLASVGDGILDPDYADISGSTITSGLAVIGAPDTGSADGGNTGCKGTGVHLYGSDHHTRADTDPAVPVLHVDGETGGSGSGIRGVTLTASSLRGYANSAIVLGACDDFSLIGCTTEFSTVSGVTGLDADGLIIGSAETGNVTLLGLAATGELGIAALAQAISGQFTICQSGQFDGLMVGKGAGGVVGKLAAIRIAGNSVQDPYIQFTDSLISSTSGWTVRMDEDQSDGLKFARNNNEMLTITASGRLVAPNIAQTDVGMGTGTLWADPADGYRVKWKNA